MNTLVGVASGLTRAGILDGAFSADSAGLGFSTPTGVVSDDIVNSGVTSVRRRYQSGYVVLDGYIQEAITLAEALENEDPYLKANISVIKAKIKIIDTLFLEVVPPSVMGSISGTAAKKRYEDEDRNLAAAIGILMEDSAANREMLEVANNARLEVAWLREDMDLMHEFCRDNTVNMAARYPPERLFEVAADGTVDAPRFPFNVSDNIFDRSVRKTLYTRREARHVSENRPQFVPVCIDGRLMAALVNAPKVTIEELE